MRIWSLHPRYLDTKGLVALWRETLLAKKVLEGKTKGYKNHPQLIRFKNSPNALHCINQYLTVVFDESLNRGYHFERNKIDTHVESILLTVTKGQIEYEKNHLLRKLEIRDPERFYLLSQESEIDSHPLFKLIEGTVEEWEITVEKQRFISS
jgi:hypothetical protein